ncbi:hypothetical protein JYU14_00605 [Simkania negevensis]|uniref:Uncharacterized protein n=1 Tax=Simkania negevensis TaxID=83561 RepID=A0ABS3ASU6_9BACT|nr:hypothetical protein [Simkania negevensis]
MMSNILDRIQHSGFTGNHYYSPSDGKLHKSTGKAPYDFNTTERFGNLLLAGGSKAVSLIRNRDEASYTVTKIAYLVAGLFLGLATLPLTLLGLAVKKLGEVMNSHSGKRAEAFDKFVKAEGAKKAAQAKGVELDSEEVLRQYTLRAYEYLDQSGMLSPGVRKENQRRKDVISFFGTITGEQVAKMNPGRDKRDALDMLDHRERAIAGYEGWLGEVVNRSGALPERNVEYGKEPLEESDVDRKRREKKELFGFTLPTIDPQDANFDKRVEDRLLALAKEAKDLEDLIENFTKGIAVGREDLDKQKKALQDQKNLEPPVAVGRRRVAVPVVPMPLKRAFDALEAQERRLEEELKTGEQEIKKFRGDIVFFDAVSRLQKEYFEQVKGGQVVRDAAAAYQSARDAIDSYVRPTLPAAKKDVDEESDGEGMEDLRGPFDASHARTGTPAAGAGTAAEALAAFSGRGPHHNTRR